MDEATNNNWFDGRPDTADSVDTMPGDKYGKPQSY